MGYYTEFELEVIDGRDDTQLTSLQIEKIGKKFSEITGYTNGQFELMVYTSFDAKWYNSREDMKVLSEEFPEYKFTLSAQGEDPTDRWMLYALNGKTCVCEAEIRIPSNTLW